MRLTCITVTTVIAFSQRAHAAMLYNSLQKTVLSPDISIACDAAFNTIVNWNTSWLESLCTPACGASLDKLSTAVTSDCKGVFIVDSQNWTFPNFMSHFRYKYDLICLADEETGDFCLDIESSWNITIVDLAQEATWPTYIDKCYFDVANGHWGYQIDVDGTCLDIFDFSFADASDDAGILNMAAADFFITKPDLIDDDNYGWPEPLEFDEKTFWYGLENAWGDVWDNITSQIWANMQLNCGWQDLTITPANDYTSDEFEDIEINVRLGLVTTTCPQTLDIAGSIAMTCQEASVYFQVLTAGLLNLNSALYCRGLTNTMLCAPLSCPIAVVDIESINMDIAQWVATYANFSLTQFYSWNPYLGLAMVANGDSVCAGPPGGAYIPPSATVPTTTTSPPTSTSSSSNTVTLTSFVSPPSPTTSGTTPYCYEWYTVQSGDGCDTILPKYGLSLATFIALNPYVDSGCSNLWPDYSYCVSGLTSPESTSSTSSTSSTGTTSAPVATPTPMQGRMVGGCTGFYQAKTGDGCWVITTNHGITQERFIDWNPAVGSDCAGLWPDYWYCVAV
ncbi:hypothetical protein BJX76DRAFT_363531 [Aspergillus varians]